MTRLDEMREIMGSKILKLYHLKVKGVVPQGGFREMSVLAPNDGKARFLAAQQAGNEGREVWCDSEKSECTYEDDRFAHVILRG